MSMEEVAQSPACDEETAICPYIGLASFKLEDAKYFFGRDKDARKIVDYVTNLTLTVLVGASGAGKSSILNAAVPKALADIRKGMLIVPFAQWYPGFYAKLCADVSRIVLTKSDSLHPERSGTHAGAVQDGQARSPSSSADSRSQSLEESSTQWVEIARTPVFFVFDQFEQYFINRRAAVQTNIDAAFEQDLAHLVNRRDLQAHVLISIREDALFELNQLRARIPNILDPLLKLDHLDHAAAREAIEGPLRKWREEHVGCAGPTSAAPELIDELIRQVSRTTDGARIEAPYLQLALRRLWEKERREGSSELRLETLKALGDAKGIAKVHFENTMKALPENERRLCTTIFDRMVTPSGMKIALSAADLANLTNENQKQVLSVLEELAGGPSRIIQCVPSPKDDRTFLFEIFHDVLARPIREWIAAERERVQQQEKLEEQKREAEKERARQQEQLERQRREAEEKHARQREEIARQQKQVAREKQLKRRYRKLAIAAGLGFLLASVFAGVATYTYRDAAMQKARAIAMRANAAIDSGDNRLGLLAVLAILPEHKSIWQWLTRPIADEATQVLAKSLYRPLGIMLQGHEKRLWQVAFSPDGKLIATASEDGTVRLWDAQPGGPLKNKSVHEVRSLYHERDRADELSGSAEAPPPVTSVAFAARRPFLATIAYDGKAHLWDTKTGQERAHWQADSESNGHVAAFSPDGETIVTGSFGGKQATVWSWHGHEGTPQHAGSLLDGSGFTHENGITSATFDVTGNLVLTTSWDKTARIWNLATRELMLELPKGSKGFDGHDGPVRSAAFSPDGKLVVTASAEKARIWRIDGPCRTADCETPPDREARGRSALLRTLQGHRMQVMTASFDRSGQRVVTASLDGTVRIWDVSTGDTLQILHGPKVVSGNRASAALSPDGRQVVIAFDHNWAYLWDIDVQAEPLPCLPRQVTSVAASRDDRRIAAAFDGTVSIFDVSRPAASSNDQRIAAAFDDTVRISQRTCAPEPDLKTTEQTAAQVMSVAFGTDSRWMATAAGNLVYLWDIGGNENRQLRSLVRSLEGHEGLVLSVAFDPAGKRLVTASQDKTARIWDLASSTAPIVLTGHQEAVFSAAFSSDGRKVVTGSFDKTLRMWDAESGRELTANPIDAGKPVLAVTFTSDDRYLVTSLLDDSTEARPFRTWSAIWNVQTGRRASERDVDALRLADYLVIYSQDAGILFSKGIPMLPRNRDSIRNVIGSAGGVGVYTVSLDGEVRMWRLPPSEPHRLIRYAHEIAQSELPEQLRSLSPEECRELGLSCAQSTGWAETVYRSFFLPVEGLLQATALIIHRLRLLSYFLLA